MHHFGRWETGNVTRADHTIIIYAVPQSINCSAESADVWFGSVTVDEAVGFGRSRFAGICFWGPYWEPQVDHRIDLRRDTRDNWMSGTFWWEDGVTGFRGTWKQKTFFAGETFNNNVEHRRDRYLLDNNSDKILRSLIGECPA